MKILRSKTWKAVQQQVEDQQSTINQLQQALNLIPLDKMEHGDVWLPSITTIKTLKSITTNLENQ